jgi:hypothetical protein
MKISIMDATVALNSSGVTRNLPESVSVSARDIKLENIEIK